MTEAEQLQLELIATREAFAKYKQSVEEDMWNKNLRIARLEDALSLIAMPRRPDGTYNRSREACEQLARRALEE